MRGKLSVPADTAPRDGITPADAGKTLWQIQTKRAIWDHPRGCGENGIIRSFFPESLRITPADAGKTDSTKYICKQL